MQRPEADAIVTAQTAFHAKLLEQRRGSPEAAKARARVDELRKSAETPELLKSRAELNSAIRVCARPVTDRTR
jgi:hypothetical protein